MKKNFLNFVLGAGDLALTISYACLHPD